MSSSNIGYKGQVKVTVTNKSPIVRKNSGTDKLFNLLAKVMSGQNLWRYSDLPSQIDICVGEKSILINPIKITQSFVSEETVTLSAMLHSTNTNVRSESYPELGTLYLYDDNQTCLAKIEEFQLKHISAIFTDQYAQCKIEWSMTFGNNTAEEEENK